jgi:hypothetical protein
MARYQCNPACKIPGALGCAMLQKVSGWMQYQLCGPMQVVLMVVIYQAQVGRVDDDAGPLLFQPTSSKPWDNLALLRNPTNRSPHA